MRPSTVEECVLSESPYSYFQIDTEKENDKTQLLSVFVCPSESLSIFHKSQGFLALDCSPLKNEYGGVLFHVSTIDGGQKPILLAYMIADEESPSTWRLFLERLKESGIPTDQNSECQLLLHLCEVFDSVLSSLSHLFSSTNHSPWHVAPSRTRKVPKPSPLLRALLTRVVFCGTKQVSSLYSRLLVESEELVHELGKFAPWYRMAVERPATMLVQACLQEVEMVFLDHEMVRLLNLDDVVSGLYELQAAAAGKRREEYEQCPEEMLTPFCQQLARQYVEVITSLTVTGVRDHVFLVSGVVEGETVREEVDCERRTCSCGWWLPYQFPCVHAWCLVQQGKLSREVVEFFCCRSALQMCPEYVVPTFKHTLKRQVAFAMQECTPAMEALSPWMSLSVLGVEGNGNQVSIWRVCWNNGDHRNP